MFGDLNDNLLSCGNKLKPIINANRLYQVINKPTRVTPDSATLLDILVTNKPELVIHNEVPQTVADHDLITATITITKPKRVPETRTCRHHGSYTPDTLCNALLNAVPSLNTIFTTDDDNAQVDTLTSVMADCIEECAPVVTTEIKKPFAPWITDEIRSAMTIRNALQSQLKLNRHNSLLQEQRE